MAWCPFGAKPLPGTILQFRDNWFKTQGYFITKQNETNFLSSTIYFKTKNNTNTTSPIQIWPSCCFFRSKRSEGQIPKIDGIKGWHAPMFAAWIQRCQFSLTSLALMSPSFFNIDNFYCLRECNSLIIRGGVMKNTQFNTNLKSAAGGCHLASEEPIRSLSSAGHVFRVRGPLDPGNDAARQGVFGRDMLNSVVFASFE